MNKKNKILMIGGAILSSILASICCVTPIIAMIAGLSGGASAFPWLHGFRPYLIIMAILSLGFAWYQKLNSGTDCICEDSGMTKFLQSKYFLGLVTIIVVFTASLPYYSSIFYGSKNQGNIVYEKRNLNIAEFKIAGMTCAGCARRIQHEVERLPGIIQSDISYENRSAVISFDKSKVKLHEIEMIINSTGYKVMNIKIGVGK